MWGGVLGCTSRTCWLAQMRFMALNQLAETAKTAGLVVGQGHVVV